MVLNLLLESSAGGSTSAYMGKQKNMHTHVCIHFTHTQNILMNTHTRIHLVLLKMILWISKLEDQLGV